MRLRVRDRLLIGVVFLSIILVTGCGTLEKLVQKEGNSSSIADWIGVSGDKNASLPATTIPSEGKTVALYFADLTGKFLVKEERMLPKTVSLARETVNQWLKGPTAKGTIQNSVSTATTLLDIAIKDSVVIVDLSKEFLISNSKVSPEVALYGLVNTLTQFSTISQVQIRIEGKPITKYGIIDASQLKYKASLVKGAVSDNTTVPSLGTGNAPGLGVVVPSSSSLSNGALPDSPSSINLFNFPPSST
ncbi:GerMN domain-containing protein [Desulfosporosinus burensis]